MRNHDLCWHIGYFRGYYPSKSCRYHDRTVAVAVKQHQDTIAALVSGALKDTFNVLIILGEYFAFRDFDRFLDFDIPRFGYSLQAPQQYGKGLYFSISFDNGTNSTHGLAHC